MKNKKSIQRKKRATPRELWKAIDGIKRLSNESIADALQTTRQTLTNWSEEDQA